MSGFGAENVPLLHELLTRPQTDLQINQQLPGLAEHFIRRANILYLIGEQENLAIAGVAPIMKHARDRAGLMIEIQPVARDIAFKQ